MHSSSDPSLAPRAVADSTAGGLFSWGLLVGLLLLWAIGILPFAPVEGDDQGVLFGGWSSVSGHDAYRALAYAPEVQPGTHVLLAAAGGIDPSWVEPAYGLMTAVGALCYAILCGLLVRRVAGLSLPVSLLIAMWFQEVQASACYMNSSSLAGAFALGAVLVALGGGVRWDWLFSGLLVAVGGWLRMDSLLLSPVVYCAFQHRLGAHRAALMRTSATALVALAGVVVLAQLSGHPLHEVFASYRSHPATREGLRAWMEGLVLLASPALVVAFVAGLCIGPRSRLLWFAAGVVPTIIVYRHSLASTKYLYYTIPTLAVYAGIFVSKLVIQMRGRPAAFALIVGPILVADGMLGLRTSDTAHRVFGTGETWAKWTIGAHKERELALVIGPGELCRHADGFRVRTGHLFAPLRWREEKRNMLDNLDRLGGFLEQHPTCRILWGNWLGVQVARRVLLEKGYACTNPASAAERSIPWTKGSRIVWLDYHPYTTSNYFHPERRYGPFSDMPTLFVSDLADVAPIANSDRGYRWRNYSERIKGIITLFIYEPAN